MKLPWSKKKESTPKKLEISDDSGFIGLVDVGAYNSFVDEDWELDQLLSRFKDETNKGHCAIWSTGMQNDYTVTLCDQPSDDKAYREVNLHISVTNERLYLANYTDLTMAAQFEDETIPSSYNTELYFSLKNGAYTMVLRQMFDPKGYDWEKMPEANFEVILNSTDAQGANNFSDVIWWEVDKK